MKLTAEQIMQANKNTKRQFNLHQKIHNTINVKPKDYQPKKSQNG